jgi:hypothetical protein
MLYNKMYYFYSITARHGNSTWMNISNNIPIRRFDGLPRPASSNLLDANDTMDTNETATGISIAAGIVDDIANAVSTSRAVPTYSDDLHSTSLRVRRRYRSRGQAHLQAARHRCKPD